MVIVVFLPCAGEVVTEGINRFLLRCRAFGTGKSSHACRDTGGIFCDLVVIPLVIGLRIGDSTTGTLFPMVICVALPCAACEVMTESIAVRQSAFLARGFFRTCCCAAGVNSLCALCFADRTFVPMAVRVCFPICTPVVDARNKYGGVPATDYADCGAVVFILKFVGCSVFHVTRSNLNVSGAIRYHFCRHTDRGRVCKFASDFNNLTTG